MLGTVNRKNNENNANFLITGSPAVTNTFNRESILFKIEIPQNEKQNSVYKEAEN
jgi:hypothetical protein